MNAGPLGGPTNRAKNDEGTHWVQASPTPNPLGATLGCSNQFKDADTAAYQALLQSIAEAERLTKEEISAIEKKYKGGLLRANRRYIDNLHSCQDDSDCTEKAKINYDKTIGWHQEDHDKAIFAAQDKEATAKEKAHKTYDAELKKAKRLYCKS